MHTFVEITYDSRVHGLSRTGQTSNLVLEFNMDQDELDTYDAVPDHVNFRFNAQSDDAAVIEYAGSIIPLTRVLPDFSGTEKVLVLNDVKLSQVGPKSWRAECDYSYDVNDGTGGGGDGTFEEDENTLNYVRIEFALGGGERTVLRSRGLRDPISAPAVPENKSNFGRKRTADGGGTVSNTLHVIGLGENDIRGAKVPAGGLRLQVTVYYKPTYIDFAFVDLLESIQNGPRGYGTYNDATFFNFDAGEVQLRGVQGGGTVVDMIPLTYDFLIKRNQTNVTDEGFANLTMLGHEVLDYMFAPKINPDVKRVFLEPDVRFIHLLAEAADYSQLEIPQPAPPAP